MTITITGIFTFTLTLKSSCTCSVTCPCSFVYTRTELYSIAVTFKPLTVTRKLFHPRLFSPSIPYRGKSSSEGAPLANCRRSVIYWPTYHFWTERSNIVCVVSLPSPATLPRLRMLIHLYSSTWQRFQLGVLTVGLTGYRDYIVSCRPTL